MDTKACYYPKDKLNLKPVVDGAKMWGVALKEFQPGDINGEDRLQKKTEAPL